MNEGRDSRIEHLERQIERVERGLVTASRLNKPVWFLRALQTELVRLRYEKAVIYDGLMRVKNY